MLSSKHSRRFIKGCIRVLKPNGKVVKICNKMVEKTPVSLCACRNRK